MLRSSFLALTLFVGLSAAAQQRAQNTIDEVVWVVGDSPILLSEIEEQKLALEINNLSKLSLSRIAEQLAVQRLFLHQAELDSISVEDAAISAHAEAVLNQKIQEVGSRENLEAVVGRSIPQIREMYKEQARTQAIVDKVQDKLTAKIKPTPAEVRDYFSKMPADSLPTIPEKFEVQIITAEPKVSAAEKQRIEERLLEFTRRVNEGETDFARLARMYSQDGSSREGGALGFMGRNQLVKEFADVAFALNDPKKVSKIVRSEYGYHIIQLIEKRGDKINVRHILLKPEIETAEFDRCLSRLDSIAADIAAHKFSFEEAAHALSDDKNSRNNNGLLSIPDRERGQLVAHFELSQLPQDIARVVADMKEGEVSKAFRMFDTSTGKDLVAVVKLKSRTAAHPANTMADFQMLQNLLISKRRAEFLDQWVREKVKHTYVRIKPEWRNESFEYSGWVK